MAAINQDLQQDTDEPEQAGPSPWGHTHVCLLCGCSLIRRQSDNIVKDNPTELQQNMINIIQMKLETRQVCTHKSTIIYIYKLIFLFLLTSKYATNNILQTYYDLYYTS